MLHYGVFQKNEEKVFLKISSLEKSKSKSTSSIPAWEENLSVVCRKKQKRCMPKSIDGELASYFEASKKEKSLFRLNHLFLRVLSDLKALLQPLLETTHNKNGSLAWQRKTAN